MESKDYYRDLGMACASMMQSKVRRHFPLTSLVHWVRPAILLNQIRFFTDLSGQLAGYVTWASLSEETEKRWIDDPDTPLRICEWNEGDRLWVIDMVVLNGDLRRLMRQCKHFLSNFREAKSLRRQFDGSVRKITTWKLS